jgi:hypothetical protein
MRLAQRSEKTALISIGKRTNKVKLIPTVQKLAQMKYKLYATYKTHKFLRQHNVESILVNKISQPNLKPNLQDLLSANRFDLIINIPTSQEASSKERTDVQVIREFAIKHNATLVTSIAVAQSLVEKLSAAKIHS